MYGPQGVEDVVNGFNLSYGTDAVLRSESELRPVLASVAHCWSGDSRQPNQATNLVVDTDNNRY